MMFQVTASTIAMVVPRFLSPEEAEVNRREFILSSAAVPLVVSLRHEHAYSGSINSDAFVCDCGHRITGLELFQMPSPMRGLVLRRQNELA